jgi:pimeloyl-ACP methyl ester carboxylesterase
MMDALRARARPVIRRMRSPFRRSLEDPSAPLSLDMRRRSSTLLVAFGGMRGHVGMLPFEFFKATGSLPVKRLFVRDLRQAWYHRGIPGHGSTVEEVAESLRGLIADRGVERLVVAGNSAGGYAALLFGTLLGADTVLCFAPQTVLDLGVLGEMDDHRWDDRLGALVQAGSLDPRWTDLSAALPPLARSSTAVELYFDASYTPDRLHAERIAALPGVRLRRLEGGAHGVAYEMRQSGQLQRVLQAALAPAPKGR